MKCAIEWVIILFSIETFENIEYHVRKSNIISGGLDLCGTFLCFLLIIEWFISHPKWRYGDKHIKWYESMLVAMIICQSFNRTVLPMLEPWICTIYVIVINNNNSNNNNVPWNNITITNTCHQYIIYVD